MLNQVVCVFAIVFSRFKICRCKVKVCGVCVCVCLCHSPVRATVSAHFVLPDVITIVFREEYGYGAPH